MDLKSLKPAKDFWPVFKGQTFKLWNPDNGIYYAYADSGPIIEKLKQKRLR